MSEKQQQHAQASETSPLNSPSQQRAYDNNADTLTMSNRDKIQRAFRDVTNFVAATAHREEEEESGSGFEQSSSGGESTSTASVVDGELPPGHHGEKTDAFETFLHLVKGYMGAGCLSLPWAVSQIGMWGGIASIFGLSLWSSYNCWTVVQLKRYMERTAMSDLIPEAVARDPHQFALLHAATAPSTASAVDGIGTAVTGGGTGHGGAIDLSAVTLTASANKSKDEEKDGNDDDDDHTSEDGGGMATSSTANNSLANEIIETASRASTSVRTNITYPDVGEWAYGRQFQSYVTTCICTQQLAICTVFISFVGENLLAVLMRIGVDGGHAAVMTATLPLYLGLSLIPSLKLLAPGT